MNIKKQLNRYRRNLQRRISRSMRGSFTPTRKCRRLQRKLARANRASRALRGGGR